MARQLVIDLVVKVLVLVNLGATSGPTAAFAPASTDGYFSRAKSKSWFCSEEGHQATFAGR
jgi:hypothetical protein